METEGYVIRIGITPDMREDFEIFPALDELGDDLADGRSEVVEEGVAYDVMPDEFCVFMLYYQDVCDAVLRVVGDGVTARVNLLDDPESGVDRVEEEIGAGEHLVIDLWEMIVTGKHPGSKA